jgi:hypothetical protein
MTYTEIYEKRWGDDPRAGREFIDQLPVEQRTAFRLIEDMSDRRGLGQEWDQIDDELKDEIFGEWARIIANVTA